MFVRHRNKAVDTYPWWVVPGEGGPNTRHCTNPCAPSPLGSKSLLGLQIKETWSRAIWSSIADIHVVTHDHVVTRNW